MELITVTTSAPVRAIFTTRIGGVSTDGWASLNLGVKTGDEHDRVVTNRTRLCDAIGLRNVVIGHQVHGCDVREVGADAREGTFSAARTDWPDGDGLVTRSDRVALGVFGADCLPVLMWRVDTGAVGAAHAGWRGLVSGILTNLLTALGDPARTSVAIGPGIGACCYPVSGELRDVFRVRFGEDVVVGEAIDLAAAATANLVACGVSSASIARYGACTSCDARRFFSYRRDGGQTGRHAGFVWREAT